MSEKIPKYAAICGIVILIASVWYQYLFFTNLDIDIFSYVNLSELTVLFLGSIPMLLLTGIVIGIYLAIIFLFSSKRTEKIVNIKTLSNEEQQRIINKNNWIFFWIGFICFLLYFGPLMMPINKATTKFISSEFYFGFRVILACVFFSLAVAPFIGAKFDIKKVKLYAGVFILIFFCSVYYTASYKLWAVKSKPDFFPTANIVLKDNRGFITNDSLILVGKTNNYLFLYHFTPLAENSYTQIIPMEEVRTINIIKYGSWYRLP